MRISKIELKNWKNFQFCQVNLQYRTFIAGPNGSGKSNFLDAIRFLRDIVKQGGGLQEAVQMRGGISKIRCSAARKKTDIELKVVINDKNDRPWWEYELIINQSGGGIQDLKAIVKKEYLKELTSEKVIVNRTMKDNESEYLRTFTHIEQATINVKFKPFVEFLNNISYLHIVPQLIRDPKSFLKTTHYEDYYGRDFLEKIQKTNKHTRKAYFSKIEKALRMVVPNFESIDFVQDQMGHPHLEALFRHWRGQGIKFNEAHFSDGTLRLIGLLWALLDGNGPLLLEEPELSLHASIVRQLPDIFVALQRKKHTKRQFILSTHSYDLFNNKTINPEEILLITPEKTEGSTIKESSSYQEVKHYLQYDIPLADIIIKNTSPTHIEQLSLSFDKL